jgi:hypothetical protein
MEQAIFLESVLLHCEHQLEFMNGRPISEKEASCVSSLATALAFSGRMLLSSDKNEILHFNRHVACATQVFILYSNSRPIR